MGMMKVHTFNSFIVSSRGAVRFGPRRILPSCRKFSKELRGLTPSPLYGHVFTMAICSMGYPAWSAQDTCL